MTRKKVAGKSDLLSSKWPLIKRYFFIPLVLILIFILLLKIFVSNFFPISTVQVIDPLNRVNQQALQSVVSKDINKGFFQVNLSTIKADVLTLPWVKNAMVARKWPHNIQITIEEKEPLARWGNEALLDTQGEIFTPSPKTIPSGLPTFTGPTDAIDDITENYIKFNQLLQTKHVSVQAIDVTDRMSWLITLNSGTQIDLGRKELFQRLDRFVQIYDTIFATTHKKAQYVDMRYPNAMAVRWQNS